MIKIHRENYKESSRIMQTIRIGYIRQVVISSVFSLVLMMTAHVAGMSAVFAQDKELAPEVQLDLLVTP